MAYVYTWAQILNLLGSRDSDEIDDSSREAKAGFDERFRDILWDVEADPWQVKVPGVNVDGTQSVRLTPPLGALLNSLTFDVATFSAKPTAVSVGGVWIAAIPIPRGSTIKSANFVVSRKTAGATVTCKIVKVENAAGTAAPIPTVVASTGAAISANMQNVSPGVITGTIGTLEDYLLVCEITADGADVLNSQLHAVDVFYNVAGVTP